MDTSLEMNRLGLWRVVNDIFAAIESWRKLSARKLPVALNFLFLLHV